MNSAIKKTPRGGGSSSGEKKGGSFLFFQNGVVVGVGRVFCLSGRRKKKERVRAVYEEMGKGGGRAARQDCRRKGWSYR